MLEHTWNHQNGNKIEVHAISINPAFVVAVQKDVGTGNAIVHLSNGQMYTLPGRKYEDAVKALSPPGPGA
jgi:hypothetical protein